ncbi:MAG: sulfatase [Rikenellaceae bacterium]
MSKVTKTLMVAAAGAALVPSVEVAAKAKKSSYKQPNVIFIMSDDHTTQGIGVYGSRLAVLNPTPVIDELASESIIFDNVYCNNSISTPSRTSIMTGQYSHVNGVLTLDERLTTERLYMNEEFQKLGYQTAIVGKWHLGCEPKGFDYYSVFTEAGEQGKYFNPLLACSEITEKEFPKNTSRHEGHSSDIVTDVTLGWLKEKRDPNKPFLLLHHYKAPHDDFEFAPRYADYLSDVEIPRPESMTCREGFGSAGSRGYENSLDRWLGTSVSNRNVHRNYVAMYKINTGDELKDTQEAHDEYVRRYLRCVKGVDDNLKRLFDYLKAEGLWENTIIVYTGDQGMMLGEHDLQDKRWMYEESMRMPYIMKVPGQKVKGGSHNDELIQNVDFTPTLLSLAGLEQTPSYMQGLDFSPVFEGKALENWRDAAYYRYWMHLIHHNVPAHMGIRTKEYKLIFFYGRHYDPARYGEKSMAWLKGESAPLIAPTPASFELYDLKNDPFERTNVANDPKYAEVLAEMKQKLIRTRVEVGDNDALNPEILEVINAHLPRK